MKLTIWLQEEPLSDDADGTLKTYVDLTFMIGNNLHEGRELAMQLADTVHRHLLKASTPPSAMPTASPTGPEGGDG